MEGGTRKGGEREATQKGNEGEPLWRGAHPHWEEEPWSLVSLSSHVHPARRQEEKEKTGREEEPHMRDSLNYHSEKMKTLGIPAPCARRRVMAQAATQKVYKRRPSILSQRHYHGSDTPPGRPW